MFPPQADCSRGQCATSVKHRPHFCLLLSFESQLFYTKTVFNNHILVAKRLSGVEHNYFTSNLAAFYLCFSGELLEFCAGLASLQLLLHLCFFWPIETLSALYPTVLLCTPLCIKSGRKLDC